MSDIAVSALEDGFAVFGEVCKPQECDSLLAQVEPIGLAGTRCLLDHAWCSGLATILKSRLARDIPEIVPLVAVQCTFFNKSQERNWLVAYHQDRSIPVSSSEVAKTFPGWSEKEGMTFVQGPAELLREMLAVRLHLDHCTLKNGPLRVIPGSHRFGILSPKAITDLVERVVEKQLLVEQGGVVAMRPLVVHASSKSRTTTPRRVLHFLFGPRQLPSGLAWRYWASS